MWRRAEKSSLFWWLFGSNFPLINSISCLYSLFTVFKKSFFVVEYKRLKSVFIFLNVKGLGRKNPISAVGISKNYSATSSGSPEVELRFCPKIILFKYWIKRPDLSTSLWQLWAFSNWRVIEPNHVNYMTSRAPGPMWTPPTKEMLK